MNRESVLRECIEGIHGEDLFVLTKGLIKRCMYVAYQEESVHHDHHGLEDPYLIITPGREREKEGKGKKYLLSHKASNYCTHGCVSCIMRVIMMLIVGFTGCISFV